MNSQKGRFGQGVTRFLLVPFQDDRGSTEDQIKARIVFMATSS